MSKLDPYEGINFIERHAEIINSEGEIIFSEKVTFPDYFSDNDVNIVASKYLCNEGKKKETHLKEMIDRVSDTISNWGFEDGYFKTEEERDIFNYKLKYYQVHQYCAFNSPVYFNIGLRDHPQLSACFILSIEDNMSSITEVGALEARIFKQGSGSGINYSPLRSTFETVSGGGFASGPVSFLQSHDLSAGVIKSGGTLRRSAKLACLDDTHPNIEEFICCKEREEEKLRILQEAGFKPKKGYDLSDEVFFQNTNISVRLSDKFMEAVENDDDWWTYYVSSGQKHKKYKARDLLKLISKQAWKIADPGVQFHDNINKMHTCPEDGDIVSSNPCLPDWAPVLTPNGYKRFSDIENKINIGGEDKECSDVFETGWKRVYKVELESGLDIYATANHKILTKRGDVELEKLNTEIDEIKVNFIPIKLEIDKNSNEYRLGKTDAYNLYNKELKEEIDLLSKTLDYQFGFIDFFRSINKRYIFIPESHHLKQIQLILASKGIYSEVIKNRYLKIYFEDEKLDKREYQKIKSIKSISAVKVYDITVPDGNHFVTSGVVVHNCSEYMFINNSSCNLSAINYMKFISKDFDDEFHLDIKMLQDVVETLFTAQDIFIDRAKYPNEEITKNSHEFRPIGLGHSNLGAVLMYLGYPYDSKKGRRTASYLTALITAIAYKTSSKLAEIKGPFKHFDKNQEHFYRVLLQHKASLNEVVKKDVGEDLFLEEIKEFSVNVWDDILELIDNKQPFRNAQATLLAPNGTTSYLMGCATTGIEPEFSLIRYKRLSGSDGAVIKHFNPILKEALQNLICSNREVNDALKQIEEDNCIDNVDVLSEDEKKIFSTSVSPGKYEIPYTGHLKMLAALQPFVSGSISKCVTGDTLILTNKGIKQIDSFYNDELPDQFSNLEIEVGSLFENQKTDSFYYGGIKDTIKITCLDERHIEGTANHKIIAVKNENLNWFRLDELSENDYVVIPMGKNIWSETNYNINFKQIKYNHKQKPIKVPKHFNEEIAWFFGAYTADGNTTKSNWTITITNNNINILNKCQKIVKKHFGISGKIATDQRNGVKRIYFNSKYLVELFENLGFKGLAGEKDIPPCVLESKKETVINFINGLWLDGYVSYKNRRVAICLKSEKIIKKLQLLLNNFGIPCNISIKFNKEYNTNYYDLYIGKEFLSLFNQIFTIEEIKKEKLEQLILENQKLKKYNSAEIIPFALNEVKQLITRKRKRTDPKFKTLFYDNPKNLTRIMAKRIYDEYHFKPLQTVFENNLYFVKIKEIQKSRNKVYDFHIPSNHTFIANGIFNHNTVNMPHNVTEEDIYNLYLQAWKMGLKCVAIYRDGSKQFQPLSTSIEEKKESKDINIITKNIRKKLPKDRSGKIHKFRIGGQTKGYIMCGEYDNGELGEIFINISKQGSTLSGLMDVIATLSSISLQYGVPLKDIVRKMMHQKFEPAGFTDNEEIRTASSLVDYIFKFIGMNYLNDEEKELLGLTQKKIEVSKEIQTHQTKIQNKVNISTEPCPNCGMLLRRLGSCSFCVNCNWNSGSCG